MNGVNTSNIVNADYPELFSDLKDGGRKRGRKINVFRIYLLKQIKGNLLNIVKQKSVIMFTSKRDRIHGIALK